jgi:hypothetical protein
MRVAEILDIATLLLLKCYPFDTPLMTVRQTKSEDFCGASEPNQNEVNRLVFQNKQFYSENF